HPRQQVPVPEVQPGEAGSADADPRGAVLRQSAADLRADPRRTARARRTRRGKDALGRDQVARATETWSIPTALYSNASEGPRRRSSRPGAMRTTRISRTGWRRGATR